VKVESLERPDAARRGQSDFFSLLNGWKASVALPFSNPEGRARLAALVEQADIVVEASRPRALAQLGLDAEAIVAQRGSTWVSITGHGRDAPHGDWVAFGDDAAAAGGLLARDVNGDPCFCGDAIADPLTGLHAALAAWSSWAHGGGRMVELSLAQVAGWVRTRPLPTEAPGPAPLPRPPRARRSTRPAPALGADTDRILGQLEC
jgi:crotonobetainyl-CoA:carnitine CoA-transferase CaiB-like acyl-CoA transferase